MATAPLTHHEILALVAPCTRAGRHVDLAASDRLARRLVFKPQDHAALVPPLREVLELENPEPGRLRLIRTLADPAGLRAHLVAEGGSVAELLSRLTAPVPAGQFDRGPGWDLATSHRVDADGSAVMTGAELRLDGLTFKMSVSAVPRIPAVIELEAPGGDIAELPPDLLAVLGWRWARLEPARGGWRSSLALRGRGTERSRDAQAQLRRAAVHLARTLAEPPQRFHDRQRGARWRVTLRRAVPLAVCLAVIAAALAVPALDLGQDSVWRMLIFNAPPILLALFFALREMPRVEIPPFPRPPTAARWRCPPAAPGVADRR